MLSYSKRYVELPPIGKRETLKAREERRIRQAEAAKQHQEWQKQQAEQVKKQESAKTEQLEQQRQRDEIKTQELIKNFNPDCQEFANLAATELGCENFNQLFAQVKILKEDNKITVFAPKPLLFGKHLGRDLEIVAKKLDLSFQGVFDTQILQTVNKTLTKTVEPDLQRLILGTIERIGIAQYYLLCRPDMYTLSLQDRKLVVSGEESFRRFYEGRIRLELQKTCELTSKGDDSFSH